MPYSIKPQDSIRLTATPPPISKAAVYGSIAGAVFGSTLWLVLFAIITREFPLAFAILTAAVAIFYFSTKLYLDSGLSFNLRVNLWVVMVLFLLNILVVNLRWEAWIEYYRLSDFYSRSQEMPLWRINLMIVVLFASLAVSQALIGRQRQAESRK